MDDVNEYDNLLEQQQNQQVKSNLMGAVQTNPDQYAKANILSRTTGLPAPVIARNLDTVQNQQNVNEYDQLLQDSPKLKQQMVNPNFANVAHDDLDNLSVLEKTLLEPLKGLGGVYNQTAGVANLLLGAAPVLYDKLTSLVNGTPTTENADAWFNRFVEPLINNQQAFSPSAETGVTGKALNQIGGLAGALSQIISTGGAGADENAISTLIGKSAASPESLGNTLNLIKGTAGAQATNAFKSMSVVASQQMVDTARQVVADGGTPQDAVKAGLTSYLTNIAMGFGPLSIPGGVGTRALSGAVYMPAISEVNRQAMNLALPDDQQQAPLSAEDQAINALLGSITGGIMGPRKLGTFADVQKANSAQETFNTLAQLTQTATASKLRERDPVAFKQFIQDASDGTPLQNLYIDGKTLQEALDAHGVLPEQLATTMPEVAEQLPMAAQTGGDVRIPIADYATHIAGQPLQDAVLPHLKAEPDGMSFIQSQESQKNLQSEMEQRAQEIIDQKNADAAAQNSADGVEANLSGDVGHNELLARATRDLYLTKAQELGISPGELYHGGWESNGESQSPLRPNINEAPVKPEDASAIVNNILNDRPNEVINTESGNVKAKDFMDNINNQVSRAAEDAKLFKTVAECLIGQL